MSRAKISPSVAILLVTLFTAGLTALFVGSEPRANAQAPAQVKASLKLPLKEGSVRFAIIGDTGRGNSGQIQVGKQMAAFHQEFPFDFVIMAGDNIYGADGPADMVAKFEAPYKPLLDAGVKFWASLGNHDNPNQRFYKLFNMGGNRYYTFRPAKSTDVRFFAIDSNYIDKEQLDWLEKELASSNSDWKIAFFHHPPYSSGRTHGSALETRAVLEPLFVKYGVSAVFNGHDHFYERVKPQKGGIVYWVSGAGGSLRKGDIRATELTAKGFDTDYHFIIAEIIGNDMYFQAISRTGATIESGVLNRPGAVAAPPNSTPTPVPVPVDPAPVPKTAPTSAPVPVPPASQVPPVTPSPKGEVLPSPSATPTPMAPAVVVPPPSRPSPNEAVSPRRSPTPRPASSRPRPPVKPRVVARPSPTPSPRS